MKSKYLPLFLLVIYVITLRLLPILYWNEVYSTDSWPILGIASKVAKYTPSDIFSKPISDEYNVFWPLLIMFNVIYNTILDLNIKFTSHLMTAIVSSTTFLAAFIFTRAVLQDTKLALIFSFLYSSLSSNLLMTASITKEAHALPFFFLILCIYVKEKWRFKDLCLLTFLTIALTITHHLTSLIWLLIVTFTSIILVFKGTAFLKQRLIYLALTYAIMGLHFYFFGIHGLKTIVSIDNAISLIAFESFPLIIYVLGLVFYHGKNVLWRFWIVALILCLIILALNPLPANVLLQIQLCSIPLLLISFVGMLGYLRVPEGIGKSLITSWVLSNAFLVAYFYFTLPLGLELVLTARSLNFLLIPILLLFTARLSTMKNNYLLSMLAMLIVALLLTPYILSVFGNVEGFGEYFTYKQHETECYMWFTKNISCNESVLGDLKARYALKGFYGLQVDTAKLIECLRSGKCSLYAILHWENIAYNRFYFNPIAVNYEVRCLNIPGKIYDSGMCIVCKT